MITLGYFLLNHLKNAGTPILIDYFPYLSKYFTIIIGVQYLVSVDFRPSLFMFEKLKAREIQKIQILEYQDDQDAL